MNNNFFGLCVNWQFLIVMTNLLKEIINEVTGFLFFFQMTILKVSTSIFVIHLFKPNVGNICGSSFQVPTVLDLVGACVCDERSITPIEILSGWT